ncbi:MAG: TolC family protein [Bacteroidales bacterium]|nr:TolC family protein [Bacteroidales bacterium]
MWNKIKIYLVSLLFLVSGNILWAQEIQDSSSIYKFTVDEAINHALQYNASVKNAAIDIEIAKKTVWETTAIGLPIVSANISVVDNLDLRTTLFPDFITSSVVGINQGIFGLTPIAPIPESRTMPVQFGSQYGANWGITATQLIFSGEYIVGLQASKAYLKMSKNAMEKTKIDTREAVSQSYYNALVMDKSVELTQFTYMNMIKVLEDMQERSNSGFIEQLDVDQMQLTVNNMKSSLSSIKIYRELAHKMLKIQLGLSIKDSVVLKQNLNEIILNTDYEALLLQNFDLENFIDYKIINNQENLQKLSLKQQQSKTLPTLSAYYTFGKDAQRDSFNFFQSGDEYPWFQSSSIGLQLNIPIFASGSRYVKIQKEKLALNKITNNKFVAEESFQIQFEQNKAKLIESVDAFKNAEKNMQLSLSIKNNILAKYRQGLASSLDLAQAQNQNLQAQNTYFQKMIQLLNNKVALEKMLESKF